MLGDRIHAPAVGVHEVHVGQVERRQVLIVEADPLAVLAPVGLELLGCLRVFDDLVDAATDPLHGLEVDPLELLGLLRTGGLLLGVEPHQLRPAILNEVDVGLRSRHRLGEVDDPLTLPAWLEAVEPVGVGGLLVPDAHCTRRPLEHEELISDLGHLRHDLDRRGACSDDADPLADQLVHGFGRTTAGVAVVPAAGVERLALERLDPRDPRKLGLVQDATGEDDEPGGELIISAGRHCPALSVLIPDRIGHVGLEERFRVQVERSGEELGVLEDLRGAGVVLRRHEAGLLEEGEVDEGLDVAHAAGVAIPVPGPAKVASFLDDANIGDAVLGQVDGGEHAREPATHDDHRGLLDHRRPREARLDEGVTVELVIELAPLVHALGSKALLLLCSIAIAQLIDRWLTVLRPHGFSSPQLGRGHPRGRSDPPGSCHVPSPSGRTRSRNLREPEVARASDPSSADLRPRPDQPRWARTTVSIA